MATVHSTETLAKSVFDHSQRVKRIPQEDVDTLYAYARQHERPLIWAIRTALSAFAEKIRTSDKFTV